MRKWLNLFERDEGFETLLDLLDEWSWGHRADATWNGERNDLAKRIIELAKDFPPKLTGYLYRGTGVPDNAALALLRGETVTLQPTPQILNSWTHYEETARMFCHEAAENKNYSAVVLKVAVERLQPVVDFDLLTKAREHVGDEGEVLVLAEPLRIGQTDVLEIWLYDEEAGEANRVR